MKTKTIQYHINRLHELFGHEPLPAENNAIVPLVQNISWRPDITDIDKRLIAAAIQLSVSGKASKKICINKFLRTGFVPLFQECRERVSALGLIPKEYSKAEQIYHNTLNAQDEIERQQAAAAEVDKEIALEKL